METFKKNIFSCKIAKKLNVILGTELILSPNDYLWCNDESELLAAIQEDLCEAIDYGDIFTITSGAGNEYRIPKEFIDIWKLLKQ